MTRVIAITGGIATGKSAVGKILRNYGFKVVDLDQLVHQLENYNQLVISQIRSEFGEKVISTGKIDRKKLAKIVFNDTQALKRLVRILNPFIIKEICNLNNEQVAFVEAPTLFENGLQIYVDKIVVVACNPLVQMQRLVERNNLSISEANTLINKQWPQSIKQQLADFSIDSSAGLEALTQQVQILIDNLR